MTARLHDWPQRLDEYIASRKNEPFSYATHDCCQFAAGAVEAVTGENPSIRWQYRNEVGADRLIREAGGIDGLVTQALGEPCHPSQAGRGDIVLAELEQGPTVGVCVGRECVFAAQVGLSYRPRSVILQAWKVR
jgi:hypothetical protein